jgi:hypothetical protein
MLDELLVEAKLAERYRTVDGWNGRWRRSAPAGWRAVPRYEPMTERPRPDARRILGRWLAARRAALGAASTDPLR